MIDTHHKLRPFADARYPLVEVFRKADLVDVSLGLLTCGVRRPDIMCVKARFPNAGFHRTLARLVAGWAPRHLTRPLPVLKW